jgi:hypothetical protein
VRHSGLVRLVLEGASDNEVACGAQETWFKRKQSTQAQKHDKGCLQNGAVSPLNTGNESWLRWFSSIVGIPITVRT